MAATSAVSISPPAHQGPIAGSLHTNSRGPTCEQQAPGLHGISQDPGASFHPQPPVFVRPFFYVHAPPPPQPPPPPPFLHYQWPMPFPYNPFAAFPGMGYGMVMPPFPPHPYMNAPAHFLHHPHPHVQPVDRRFLHSPVYAPSAPYQNPNRTHRSHQSHTGNVRETVNCEVQTEPIQIGRYGERSPLIDSDSGRATGSNSPSAEVRNNTLSSSASLTSAGSPDSIVPVCSSFQQEVVKERHVSVPDILMSWRSGTPQARILKLADNLPQNDDQLPSYETEKGHQKSFYQSPTQTKNGPVVADSADDDAERNLNSKNGATLYQILKLSKAHGEWKAEGRRENEPVGLNGSQKRSLPYTDKLLHSHKKSRKLPNNEQEDEETNPHGDTTEIIPYQMSLNVSQMERKMNESVESLPPFIPSKEWLLQNGMLDPEVSDSVPMSKTLSRNDNQLLSHLAEEEHKKSSYQSPTQTENSPLVPDGANDNAKGSLSSKNSPTFFELKEAHEVQKSESRRENEPVGLVDPVRRMLLYTDELPHSRNESQTIPDNEQEDADKTNPHEDTTPYQIKKTTESVCSAESLPLSIPNKDSLLQNGMLEFEVTDSVPMSKTPPQNDHHVPSYEAEEEHVRSVFQRPTRNKNGPVMADAAYTINAEGNLSSMDSATLFKIFKLRKAHEERLAESMKAVRRRVPCTDELRLSQNESQKLPENEQEDGDETNPQADTTEIIPYEVCSSQPARKMNESVKSLAPSMPAKKSSDMDASKTRTLKQGKGIVPLAKGPLASPTPRQSKILFTITEDDTDTNRCRVIGQNGVDVEDEACRNKEVQNQQLCVQTAAQKIADVSPSKTHLVDCGVQCSELLEHNCVCEMTSSMGPSRWHQSKPLDMKKANYGPAEGVGGKRKKRRGGMITGGMSSDMHSSQQEAYNGNYCKPWKSQDVHGSQQEVSNGNFCRPWKSQGRYGRNRR
ncbi:uncharacterized protein LOC116702551 isoform X2 [Etheostoma spectabile]|uniref:uncharacterized protein LOC116702551 isoform X2 n=1 Tax=Etheostoma spectabile TaxID=54343 RepID=UPI0013AF4962|nr:uncharacterized protein LOC116702551 isoform X2 [Etheostoma spectabile]